MKASSSPPQFRCAGYRFELRGEGPLHQRLVALLADLACPPTSSAVPWEITVDRINHRIIAGGEPHNGFVRDTHVAPMLISALTHRVMDTEPEQLHFHAAAVIDDARTLLTMAPSGSGKSTLTCALVAAGATYRTDEVVAVNPTDGRVSTYPKPIIVKHGSIPTVERLTGLTAPPDASTWEITASEIGLVTGHDAPVATIVFVNHVPEQAPVVEPLHRATAIRRMLADSQDAIRFGPASVEVAARLVAGARCISATGGDAGPLAAEVLRQHRSDHAHGELAVVPPPANPSAGAGPRRASSAHSVIVDGRAVVFACEPARLIELDEAQSLWWSLLDGADVAAIVDDVAAATRKSVAEIAAIADAVVSEFGQLGLLDR